MLTNHIIGMMCCKYTHHGYAKRLISCKLWVMGFMLFVEDGRRLLDVERRFDEDNRLFYYIVQIDGHSIHFRGNTDYAGGGKFMIPDEKPDGLPESLFEQISDGIEIFVT